MAEEGNEETRNDQDAGTAQDRKSAADSAGTDWQSIFGDQDPQEIKKALDHARTWEKRAKDNTAAAQKLREIEEAQKTEAEKQADKLATLQQERDQAVVMLARQKAVAKHDLPADAAELISGSNEDEINASAERLAALIKQRKGPQPDPSQGRDRSSSTGDFIREQLAARR